MLILRRVKSNQDVEDEIAGEFILSEKSNENADLEMIRSLRRVLPLQSCIHVQKSNNYDKVQEVIRVIREHHSNPNMDLSRVAREVSLPPDHLSRLLNREVGVSFRQLLKATRIEEAKTLLASKRLSIKEVAARVGFSDSHYFSRTFKEMTGLSASEYQYQDAV
jgi:YesN/AraC family two-component response regulator